MATYSRFQMQTLGWRGWLGLIVFGALGIAAAVALIVVSLGIAIVLIPVVAIAVLVGRWRLKKMMAGMQKPPAATPGTGRIIEAEYQVIDSDEGRRP